MIKWRTERKAGSTDRMYIGTYKGARCVEIWQSRNGVGFSCRSDKQDIHAVRYRRAPSVDYAKEECTDLVGRANGKRLRGVEIMRRLKHA